MRTNLEHSNLFSPKVQGLRLNHVTMTMTGTLNIPDDGPTVWVLDPGGTNRVVKLPPIRLEKQIVIANVGVTGNITVADFSGLSLVTLSPQAVACFYAGSARWTWISSLTPFDFGIAIIKPGVGGVVGDGVTDDRLAIQNILDSGAKEVWLVNTGTDYIMNGPTSLVLPNGVHFRGLGSPVIKLKPLAVIPGTMLTNTATAGARHTNSRLEGIVFDGNRENNIDHGVPVAGNQPQGWTGTLTALVSLAYVDNLKIFNCEFRNSFGSALWCVDCVGEVSSNVVTACRKAGIANRRFTDSVEDCRVTNNRVRHCNVGIHGIFGTDGNIIANNVCQSNSDLESFPSFAYGGTYPNVYPLAVGFLTDVDPGYVSPVNPGDGAGIELTGLYSGGSQEEKHTIIEGNRCKSNQTGIRLEQDSKYTVVNGNICDNNLKSGILVLSAQEFLLTNNICRSNAEHGIDVSWATAQSRNAFFAIKGNYLTANTLYGVQFEGTLEGLIDGNVIASNGSGALGLFADGATATACDKIKFTNNLCIQNSMHFLFGDGAAHSNVEVTGNTFSGVASVAKLAGFTPLRLRGNVGIETVNGGTSSVGASTTVNVTHNLDITPLTQNISITPTNDPAGTDWYVSAVGATNFTVTHVGAGTLNFAWRIND